MAVAGPHCPRASVGQPVLLGRGESCIKQAPQPGEDVRDRAGRWPCFLFPTYCGARATSSGWMLILRVWNRIEAKAGRKQGWMCKVWCHGNTLILGALSHPRRLVPRKCSAATEKLNFACAY